MLLLDRQEFPHDKPCGDGLMPHTAYEVSLMGLGAWLEEPHHAKFTGFSIYTQTATLDQSIPPTIYGPRGYVIPRLETDARLLERATVVGAQYYGGVRATGILRSSAGNVTGIEAVSNGEVLHFDTPLVVVADGSGGGLARELKAHQNFVARRQYFRGIFGTRQDHLHVCVTRDLNESGGGYGWIFYLGDGRANVGAGVSTRTLEHTGRNLKDFFDCFLEEPRLFEWLEDAKAEGPAKSWPLRTGIWGARRCSRGLLLVGDAGSMIHPISGEGVGYAMESGRLAAAWAHEAHAKRDFSATLLSGYERQLRRQRAREQLSGLALIHALPNLALLEPLFKASEIDERLRRTFIEIFTGDAPVYALVKHPRAFTSLLRSVRS